MNQSTGNEDEPLNSHGSFQGNNGTDQQQSVHSERPQQEDPASSFVNVEQNENHNEELPQSVGTPSYQVISQAEARVMPTHEQPIELVVVSKYVGCLQKVIERSLQSGRGEPRHSPSSIQPQSQQASEGLDLSQLVLSPAGLSIEHIGDNGSSGEQQGNSNSQQLCINRLCYTQGEMLLPGNTFDGRFIILPMRNYSQHHQDAVNGRICSFEGPPIHTGPYGYKLGIRMFPVGIDHGDSRHAGLFIGMMPGKYDNILKWPFMAIITLTILDQGSSADSCNDISRTFVTSGNQRAFQKPIATGQSDMLYGYPEFVPIEVVCSPRYSKDDTVFIKIEIRPCGIR